MALGSLQAADFSDDFFVEEVGSEEEGGSKRRIMSVELALQREYAYVAKVAKLQLELQQNTHVPLQVPPSTSEHKVNGKPASKNLSCLAPLELQQPYAKQAQPSENLSQSPACLNYHNKPLRIRPSDNFSSLPRPQLHQSCPKQTLQIQPSDHLMALQPAQPRPSHPIQPLQIQPSDNLSTLPQSQRQDSYHKQAVKIPHTDDHMKVPPLQPQQFASNQTLQIKQSQNLTCLPPQQAQQSYAKQGLCIQAARNPIYIPPPQLPQHISRQIPLVKKAGMFCKACQIPCTGPLHYKQHCRGRKHRARVEEFKMLKRGHKNNGGSRVVKPFWCDICRVQSTDEYGFSLHLNGKKHAICVQAINNARAAQVVVGETSIGGGHGRYALALETA